ncbi:MAG TPA: DUF4394 domain-containing protein, partial [Pyrinomonadaceae bacterium]|nr:DUF4394 domain-containing protein [Pyrinomonadaceae bacterium]
MPSLKFNRSYVVLVLLFVLTLPTMALPQKAKQIKKVPTPTGAFPGELVYALTTGNSLISFDSVAPGSILSSVTITGLQAGENVLGIDFRPVTRQLYALGSTSRLYTINLTTGVATIVGAQFTPALVGTAFGFDFNPTVDRIRVTSNSDQNLRLNPNNGTVAGVDNTIVYIAGDPNAGFDPSAVGSAYTNNFVGATTTTLYDIDSNQDTLVIQNPPNNGTLNTVGPLGFDTSELVGFDISRVSSTAFASLTAPAAVASGFYTVNLITGAVILVGTIGGGATIRGIAIVPTALAGDLLISEFRLRGLSGASDEFVEIYNPSSQPLTVATFDGSSGFSLAASDGVARFTIPNGTV